MGTVRVTVSIDGVEQVLSNLTTIGEKAEENLVKLTADLAHDTETEWKAVTHRRSGRLQDADQTHPEGLMFTLNNATRYYDWVNDGHNTPRGWHTKHGYRPAKRRSHVAGQEMTQKGIEFIEQNIDPYLSKFLDF